MSSNPIICYLADSGSHHTQRWAQAFARRNYTVVILSLRDIPVEGVQVVALRPPPPLRKVGYLTTLLRIRKALNQLRPAIIHAHYASSYGLLAAIADRHPLIISCWGTDIFEFPRRSILHRAILKRTLSRADVILATGEALAAEAGKYTEKKITITPFGVDIEMFKPSVVRAPRPPTVGIVKPLRDRYYGFTNTEAFHLVVSRQPDARLVIVGDGPDRSMIESRISQLGLNRSITILPEVPHVDIPAIVRGFDVMVLPSNAESFGVVALEAASCEVPVVASNIGGLPEVVSDGKTGFLVAPGNVPQLADRLLQLLTTPELRQEFGRQGRALVREKYDWQKCVDRVEDVYMDLSRY